MSKKIDEKNEKNDKKQIDKEYRRHLRIWRFSHLIAPMLFKHRFRYEYEKVKNLEEPCLILPNHTCYLDPVLVGLSFPKNHMYFMASEHIYRRGLVSKILYWTFCPIAKMKGSSDTLAVMKAIRALRSGKNVCLFPEGNRTFNGDTVHISEAIGKLVKTTGANMLTYKISGGYFTNPRWGYGLRKGKMTSSVVAFYPKERLKEMTPAEITAIIRRDLKENAYERQREEPIRYVGKNRAEGMECAVCVCPKCRSIGTIATEKDSVFCKKCGVKTEYDEYCFFTDDFIFKTVEEWDLWQDEFFKTYISQKKDSTEPLFSDDEMACKILTPDHIEKDLGTGQLIQYIDRLEFTSPQGTTAIKISDLPDIALYEKDGLVFSDSNGIHYEIKGKTLKNVRKYVHVCNFIRNNQV